MSASDAAVLDLILENAHQSFPELGDADFFEFFSAQHVLRDYLLDNSDIESGIVGQGAAQGDSSHGTDGGIDAMYLLVNGTVIRDTEAAASLKSQKRNIRMDLIIIQASRESGFGLNRLVRLKDTNDNIFRVDRDAANFDELYSGALLDAIEIFKVAHKTVVGKFPEIHVSFFYVTKGSTGTIALDVQNKANTVRDAVRDTLPTVTNCTFDFVGARELIELASKPPKATFSLACIDSISERGAYVAIVPLVSYHRFITDEKGVIRDNLFESNVRDYQGNVDVNEKIRNTLDRPEDPSEDFWWLNNGITIVCRRVAGPNRDLELEEPQIVNGLQTSQEVYEYFKSKSDQVASEKRNIVVRIISAEKIATQDRIIRATNSQTSIPAAHLWATDPIHRDIEYLFSAHALHYDRRKNSWRCKDIAASKVVGITELAQAVAACYLQEPDHARARPARYFKDKEYGKIFCDHMRDIYVPCALIKKRVEVFLRKNEADKRHRNNLLFYLLMATICVKLRTPRARVSRLSALDVSTVMDADITTALSLVRPIYDSHGSSDKAAKGADMVKELKVKVREKYGPKKAKRKLPEQGV